MSEQHPGAPADSASAPALTPRRIRIVFGALAVTMLLASLDQTIVSTALPTIVGELRGVDQLPWVITAYLLATTIVMPIYGRLGDLIGRRGLFLGAITIFVAGSVIAAASGSIEWLIVGRAVQGIGGGGLIITAQAIIADLVPPRERGRYMGIIGAVFAVSSVAGPLLGGLFTDTLGWRWCFWINLPLGAAAFIISAVVLPRSPLRRERPKADWLGMALMATSVTCLVLATGESGGGESGTTTLLLWIGGIVSGALFIWAEHRAAEPIIPLSLFRNRTFVVATATGLLVGVAMFAVIGYLPTFLQIVGGHDASGSGLMMIFLMAGVLVSSIASGRAITTTGHYRRYPVIGMFLAGSAMLLMSRMDTGTGDLEIGLYLVILGVGLGLTVQVLVLVVQNALPASQVGTATAGNNFFREIGATVGSAAFGSIFLSRLAAQIGASDAGAEAARSVTPEAVAALPDGQRELIVSAYADALTPMFAWVSPLFAIGLVLMIFLPNLRLRSGADEPQDDLPGRTPASDPEAPRTRTTTPTQSSAQTQTPTPTPRSTT